MTTDTATPLDFGDLYDTKAAKSEEAEGALKADGFEAALIGYGYQFNHPLAIYSRNRCINILMKRDGMSSDEATEYFDFNVIGAWVGESTPVFLDDEFGADEDIEYGSPINYPTSHNNYGVKDHTRKDKDE